MTEFFVPRTGEIVLSNGAKHVLVQGVHDVLDSIVADPAANRYGIKPVHEMTDNERAANGLSPATPSVDETLKVEAEVEASAASKSDVTPPAPTAAHLPADPGQGRDASPLAAKSES